MNSKARGTSSLSVSAALDRTPVIPDWSVVTSPMARKALKDLLVVGRWGRRFARIDPQSARVLAAVLRLYARHGRPPPLAKVATNLGISGMVLQEAIDHLARHDLVLLAPDQTSVCGAYPFTEKVTGHTVTFQKTARTLNTMCAIDALGAGAMCRANLSIRSRCRFCGNDLVARIEDHGMTLRDIRPVDAVVWVGLRQSCGCAADTLCTELLLFCSNDHQRRWRSQDHGVRGHILTAEEGFQVGKALFIDRAMMGPASKESSTKAAASADRTTRR
jgi:hypothetical protein